MMTAMLVASPPEKSSPLVLGLVYAGLISLKTTFALFVPLHLAAVTAAQIWETRRWGAALRQCGLAAVFGPEMVGYGDGTRHYAPFLIAFVPLAIAGLASTAPRRVWVMAACAVPLAIFAPNFCDRLDEASEDGFIHGFRSDAERRAIRISMPTSWKARCARP